MKAHILLLCFVIALAACEEATDVEEDGRTFGKFNKVAGVIAHGIGNLLFDGGYQPYYRPYPGNYYRPGHAGVHGGYANHHYRPGFPGYRDEVFDY